jgi:hypothetical protein
VDELLEKLAGAARDLIARKLQRGLDADAFAAGTFLLTYENRRVTNVSILNQAAIKGLRKGADAVQNS